MGSQYRFGGLVARPKPNKPPPPPPNKEPTLALPCASIAAIAFAAATSAFASASANDHRSPPPPPPGPGSLAGLPRSFPGKSAPAVRPPPGGPRRDAARVRVLLICGGGGHAGTELVRRIKRMAPGIGGFGGLFPWGDDYFVAATDGVGTKLKLAFETGIHDTIGIDLVAMSVNDIVTSGAKPLFFLDYFATSKLDVDLAEKVIKGIVDGCRQCNCERRQQSDCALLGGETAEMPGFYAEGEYDLSGFAVGAVKKDNVFDGKNIVEGDILIGLPSSGVHSNGFSLVRRVLEKSGLSLSDQLPRNGSIATTVGEALMAPTVIYVKQVLEIISKGGVKGLAHITGGGFTDNIPRVFPSGLGAKIFTGSWEVPPVFRWLQQVGSIDDAEMRRTFNMGIGMVLVVSKEAADRIIKDTSGSNPAYRIGEVIQGEGVQYF